MSTKNTEGFPHPLSVEEGDKKAQGQDGEFDSFYTSPDRKADGGIETIDCSQTVADKANFRRASHEPF